MRLYHATLKSNLESIHENGIKTSFSKGKEACIYLHIRSRNEWAKLHTAKRYSVPIAEIAIAIIAVEIPRSRLTRRWRGIWTTTETISERQYARI